MPADGLDWLPRAELLTDDEIVRLARIAVTRLGVPGIRLTGGEPLLRPGLPGLVAQMAALRPRPEVSLTTNGIALARLAEPLHEAGLDRLNVSLDTLSPQVFKQLSRRDRLGDVLGGAGRRGHRRADPGQGQHGTDAWRERPRGPKPAGVLPGPRLPAAVHRAD